MGTHFFGSKAKIKII